MSNNLQIATNYYIIIIESEVAKMSVFQDLTGQTFGYLTVESYAGKRGKRTAWNCRCVCGNTTVVTGTHLKTGHTQSCGCKIAELQNRLEDLSGQTFGYWTVLEYVGSKTHDSMWKCQCICGKIKDIRAGSLKSGNSKSCGCKSQQIIKDGGYVRKGTRTIPNLVGKRYGRLTVVSLMPHIIGKPVKWLCKCDCGNERIVDATLLYNGGATQCIECNKPFSYRKTYPRICNIWGGIKDRCSNPLNDRYSDYGGRGIKICDEWSNSLEDFVKWALKNGYQDGLTIDRIDVNGNYEPDNCRWATAHEQANNTRKNVFITYNGETHSISEWSVITGINRSTLNYRYKHYKNIEDVFEKPLNAQIVQ